MRKGFVGEIALVGAALGGVAVVTAGGVGVGAGVATGVRAHEARTIAASRAAREWLEVGMEVEGREGRARAAYGVAVPRARRRK